MCKGRFASIHHAIGNNGLHHDVTSEKENDSTVGTFIVTTKATGANRKKFSRQN